MSFEYFYCSKGTVGSQLKYLARIVIYSLGQVITVHIGPIPIDLGVRSLEYFIPPLIEYLHIDLINKPIYPGDKKIVKVVTIRGKGVGKDGSGTIFYTDNITKNQ